MARLDGMKYKKGRIKPWFWFSKVWYFVSNIAVWGYLAFQIWQCFQKYQQWPTYYKTTIVEQKYAPLPDITICAAENHGLKREVLKANGLTSKSYGVTLAYSANITWATRNQSVDISPEELFDKATYKLRELVDEIGFYSLKTREWRSIFESNPHNRENNSLVEIFPLRELQSGKCYTSRFTDVVKDMGIFKIEIKR